VTSPDQLAGRGVAAGGRVVVTAQSGRVVRADLDPDVLQMRPGALADELAQAVNDALDGARAGIQALYPHNQVDLDAVAGELAAVMDQAAQRMQQIVSAIHSAAADLASQGKLPGGAAEPDAGRLMAQLGQVASLLPGAGEGSQPDASSWQARGAGNAGDLVRAVAMPPGRIGHLEIDPAAVRSGSEQLAGMVTEAVNMALDSLRQIQREQLAAGSARRAELKKQLQELNDAALDQIREFGSATSFLLGSVQPDAGTPARGAGEQHGLPGPAAQQEQ
jgi:DNA-binding protein YbaB